MKKLLIFLVITGLFSGGYYWFTNSKKVTSATLALKK